MGSNGNENDDAGGYRHSEALNERSSLLPAAHSASEISTLGPLPSTLPPPRQRMSSEGRRLLKESTDRIKYPSSLDFERVVNLYSIQATRDRVLCAAVEEEATTKVELHGQTLLEPHDNGEFSTFSTYLNDDIPPPPPPPPPSHPETPPGEESGFFFWKLRPKKTPLGYTGRTATRWFFTIMIGLMTGVISILIVSTTDTIGKWRSNTLDSLWRHNGSSTLIFFLYATINLCLALLSSLLCLCFAPDAVGSGIPEVKAFLNGVRVKRFTSVSLFVVKVVGTILSVSSGLVIGPEGPLVHIGAILGASCTKLSNTLLYLLPRSFVADPRVWSLVMMDLSHFSKDGERRDFVSIGAAAGFASAFGAPIGGLLFTLEEASSYFSQNMFLRTLVATAIATFCLAVHHGNLSEYSIISLGDFHTSDANIFLNRVAELPLYILIAAAGGLLGGVFCQCWKQLQVFRQSVFQKGRAQRRWNLFQVAFVSLLTSIFTYHLPLMRWSCRRVDINDDLVEDKSFIDPWIHHAHQFNCPTGSINELATIFFGSREEAIGDILTDPSQFKHRTLWCVGVLFFLLMPLTQGVSVPSGIFMPTALIGSSLGGAAGMFFQEWLGQEISPSTFALLGAAALLAGIQRSTVSLCVILVEGTGQVKVLIPVIVTVVIARYVGDLITKHGLYELAMEVSHLPYLDHEENRKYDMFQVRDIMSAPPVTLGPRERAHTLVKLLRESEHHGFPVVDPYTQKFLGLVRRDQLVALLECGVFDESQSYFADDDSSTNVSSAQCSPNWTPRPGVGKSPLMHLAYHIKDDRYDYMGESLMSVSNRSLAADDFDANSWLVSIRQRRDKLEGLETASVVDVGEDSMPPLKGSSGALDIDGEKAQHKHTAVVGTNEKGNVYIKWLDPDCKRKTVHVAAVMNRGAYCVTEFCPVSKAHHLFTALGLRHLIVLGGESGGQVVGVLTRINLLEEYIEFRTSCQLKR